MTYQDEAEKLTPAQSEMLLRTLDVIADIDPDARPGHINYVSKRGIIERARRARAAIYTPIHADE